MRYPCRHDFMQLLSANERCRRLHSVALQDELPEAFFQLLVESVKVEVMLGLRDALEPDNPVPAPGHASAPPAEAAPQDVPRTSAETSQDAGDETDAPAGTVRVCSTSCRDYVAGPSSQATNLLPCKIRELPCGGSKVHPTM